MELLQTMLNRRSVRQFTGEAIEEELIEKVIKAGLASESGKAIYPWELIVVREKETLKKMADCRTVHVKAMEDCDTAIVVIGDTTKQDVWQEDCSIVMTNMHLMADALGLGSVWIQGRLRPAADGSMATEYVQKLLGYPEGFELLAILCMGKTENHPAAHTEEELKMNKVHYEKF